MSKLSYLNRLRRIDYLIRTRATGSTNEFASRLGVSRSQLCDDLSDLRTLGAPICYSRIRQTYYYRYEVNFSLDFSPIKPEESVSLGFFDKKMLKE